VTRTLFRPGDERPAGTANLVKRQSDGEAMTSDETPAGFYDELAEDYHLIFADWDTAIAWEAGIVAGLCATSA
jgi:hypothetical protein